MASRRSAARFTARANLWRRRRALPGPHEEDTLCPSARPVRLPLSSVPQTHWHRPASLRQVPSPLTRAEAVTDTKRVKTLDASPYGRAETCLSLPPASASQGPGPSGEVGNGWARGAPRPPAKSIEPASGPGPLSAEDSELQDARAPRSEPAAAAAPPSPPARGTRRVRLVRGGGRGVSD